MNRFELLDNLVKFNLTIPTLKEELSKLDWDYCEEPFVVEPIDIRNVIQRYLAGDYSAAQLESWANLIECREDLELEELIDNIVYQLANPSLEGEITKDSCKEMIELFS
ncbi:hypothetical protein [Shewanella nanhaiensis]|uniref:Uncharacterized protein n=1 Tax=Shewanella nanhaiensis TaxID=2864872 RepID=A0ABS7E3R4_9GAMM|nr:hypothetical protein [Shewanella nanhaiensis]MBW8184293.1 hypothetical protein [Shewanella nanhaiensis]